MFGTLAQQEGENPSHKLYYMVEFQLEFYMLSYMATKLYLALVPNPSLSY